jgi:hypothetical protein
MTSCSGCRWVIDCFRGGGGGRGRGWLLIVSCVVHVRGLCFYSSEQSRQAQSRVPAVQIELQTVLASLLI